MVYPSDPICEHFLVHLIEKPKKNINYLRLFGFVRKFGGKHYIFCWPPSTFLLGMWGNHLGSEPEHLWEKLKIHWLIMIFPLETGHPEN